MAVRGHMTNAVATSRENDQEIKSNLGVHVQNPLKVKPRTNLLGGGHFYTHSATPKAGNGAMRPSHLLNAGVSRLCPASVICVGLPYASASGKPDIRYGPPREARLAPWPLTSFFLIKSSWLVLRSGGVGTTPTQSDHGLRWFVHEQGRSTPEMILSFDRYCATFYLNSLFGKSLTYEYKESPLNSKYKR